VRQFHIVSRSAAALVLVPNEKAAVRSDELDLAEVFRNDYLRVSSTDRWETPDGLGGVTRRA